MLFVAMAMNLFVDANIFLDFYHFSDDDLKELKKLIDLITDGKISLIVTSQIIDEVQRNRDSRVADAYNKFRDSKPQLNLPQICKGYPEYTKITTAIKDLKHLSADLDKKLKQDINKRTLKADDTINQLFGIANLIDSEKYYDKARTRYDLGNPPGKEGSYGDSLNWTALLEELSSREDLFFISDDKDFKSPLDEHVINSFLKQEWETKKKSKIFFYTKLSDFFEEHHKDIQLKVEAEKEKLIKELADSPNFEYTHAIISRLARYVSFTDEQVRKLTKIALTNSQVNWLLEDTDVHDFFEKLIENREGVLDPLMEGELKKGLQTKESGEMVVEDIPF